MGAPRASFPSSANGGCVAFAKSLVECSVRFNDPNRLFVLCDMRGVG